jgi:hypothetical protein
VQFVQDRSPAQQVRCSPKPEDDADRKADVTQDINHGMTEGKRKRAEGRRKMDL